MRRKVCACASQGVCSHCARDMLRAHAPGRLTFLINNDCTAECKALTLQTNSKRRKHEIYVIPTRGMLCDGRRCNGSRLDHRKPARTARSGRDGVQTRQRERCACVGFDSRKPLHSGQRTARTARDEHGVCQLLHARLRGTAEHAHLYSRHRFEDQRAFRGTLRRRNALFRPLGFRHGACRNQWD